MSAMPYPIRHLVPLAGIVAGLLCTAACGPLSPSGATVILKVSHNGNEEHPYQEGYKRFRDVIQESVSGPVDVEIFPSSQLGSEEESIEMIELGVIASTPASAAALASYVPEADVLNFPFLFRDLEHFYKVLDGPVGSRIAARLEEELDCIVLGWWFSGVRNVWNADRPITAPADLEGLKIRVIGSPIVVDAFNAIGAQATTMSFGEVYSAVQQGVLDGGESDNTDLLVEKFYEVTRYVSQTEHLYLAVALLFSRKQFDKLTPEMQEAVLRAGRLSVAGEREAMERKTAEAYTQLLELGLEFNKVDGPAFRRRVEEQAVYERNAERVGGIAFVREVVEQ